MSGKQKDHQFQSVVVTGDVTIDNYIYEGDRFSSRKANVRGVRFVEQDGGAILSFRILKELIDKTSKIKTKDNENALKYWKITPPGFNDPDFKKTPGINSYSLWKPFKISENSSVWRMSRALGYGDEYTKPENRRFISAKEANEIKTAIPKILVIDDAGFLFGKKLYQHKWQLNAGYDWIILKMTGQIAGNDLWKELIKKYSDKLIVVMSASEFRGEDYKIARGTSWEQAIEDTRNILITSHNISDLTSSRHLLITFNCDGVLWLDNSNRRKPEARLLCDSTRAENEWSENIPGKVFGYLSCLTSSIAFNLIGMGKKIKTSEFISGIESGLSAMRNLLEQGHGDDNENPTGFPFKRIADQIIKPHFYLSCVSIPWLHPFKKEKPGRWMITEMLQHSPALKEVVPLIGLATQVVLYGIKILKYIPHAKFRKHATADRFEIEALRRIKYFMTDYRNNLKTNRPLSFGVFGPPGAGKSFGVKQIAYEVFGENSWLEFNLSQFTTGDLSELHGAFHQIRDKVLAGIIPVVFMDEFDSKKFEWLQYLLSPMQDGEFQEGQLKHSIGKCIFIFAGATSHSFESFGNFKNDPEGKQAREEFILKKGPDFKSRFDTYLNVMGPNQKKLENRNGHDPSDISYPLRRAIFIASKIKYESYLPAQIDLGLINALLRVPEYIHGARSLDKFLSILLSPDGSVLERTRIPGDSQLSVYVNPSEFNRLLSEPHKSSKEIPYEEIAELIHNRWLKIARENKEEISEEYDKEYDELVEEIKEDNRAAARRIQDILATVNLKIEKITKSNRLDLKEENKIIQHISFHNELLSALEHNGWWMQRIRTGWKFSEKRNNKRKLHNRLIPYSDLPNSEKEKDRQAIKDYPGNLKSVGYQINWLK